MNKKSIFFKQRTPCHSARIASKVFIEISGMCNARCPYCAQRRLKQEKHFGGIMPSVLFEQIVDHLLRLEIIDRINPAPIPLYNWGEPFLNPEINAVLRSLKKNRLSAGISSNFILKPDVAIENLEVIRELTFSLPGFSQSSYEKIHGASLDGVLSNFDSFYKKLREYSPRTSITIAWHRYLFNEKELWDAYRYFKRPGVLFSPTVAFLNDILEFMDFLSGRLSEDRLRDAESDLFLSHILKGIACCSKLSKNYCCPARDQLVIDETGQLLLCCGVTRYDSDYILGNICDMSAREIWEMKSGNNLCSECISSGLSLWVYSQGLYNGKPLPSGGGLERLKLWVQGRARSKMRQLLLSLPMGYGIINMLKRFEHRLISEKYDR